MAKEGKVRGFLRRHAFIVVFLVAIIVATANFLVYPYFIKNDLELIDIPIAKTTLKQGTKITEDMLDVVSTNKQFLPKGIYLDKSAIVDKYVAENTTIPTNGFIYAEMLSDSETVMGGVFSNLEQGQFAYTIPVAERYCKGDNFREGQYVNVHFYCWTNIDTLEDTSKNGVVHGVVAENLKIIDISASANANQIFVTFAVNEEEMAYLTTAQQLAVHLAGDIYPIIYSGSDGVSKSETNFYNIDDMRVWLKDNSYIIELSEEEKNALLNGDAEINDTPATDEVVEIVGEGGQANATN